MKQKIYKLSSIHYWERCVARSLLTAPFLKCVLLIILLSSNPCSATPSTLAHASRMSYSARAAAARTPMPTTRVRQAYAHPSCFLRPGRPPAAVATGRNPAMQASTRPRPHPTRADTAHTPMHNTRDRPTRARACRRSSSGVRPPGTVQSCAQQHGSHVRAQSRSRLPPGRGSAP